jgi:hypothetical protein
MLPDHLYLSRRHGTSWRVRAGRAELYEQRSDQGQALTVTRNGTLTIEASDDLTDRLTDAFTAPVNVGMGNPPDPEPLLNRIVLALPKTEFAEIRIVSTQRYVESRTDREMLRDEIATVRIPWKDRDLSITTNGTEAETHLAMLRRRLEVVETTEADLASCPVLWRGGSGAVLIHEALGHPAERGVFANWPAWLEVSDEPSSQLDDTAQRVTARILTRGQEPASLRREDFRAAPVRRMSMLMVTAKSSAERLPDPRIEIWIVAGGSYDPLNDSVDLFITLAHLVEGNRTRVLRPFRLSADRAEIPRRLLGAFSEPSIYPGVICGDEGQRLMVGSVAPDLLIAPLQP